MPSPRLPALLLAATLAVSCAPQPPAPGTSSSSEAPAQPPPAASSSASPAASPSDRARCLARIDHLASLPALPGAPGFDARRAEILGRAKGEPVVFTRAPEVASGLDLQQRLLLDRLRRDAPTRSVPAAYEALRYFPEKLRALLLPEGYVYAESGEMASVLVDVLKLARLFREKELFLARGAHTFRLERSADTTYRFADGDHRGEEAALLFGDRVATTREALEPRLHRDITGIVQSHAPSRLAITRLTAEGAVAELTYGPHRVKAALDDDGASLKVACTAPDPGNEASVHQLAQQRLRREAASAPLRAVIRAMVRERLRFDEPLKEEGQQDGSLRPLWRWAYEHDGDGYSFNGVGYQVFDAEGRPAPPQVCIDFVLDTFERASGTWYGTARQPRERARGPIDFEAMALGNRRSAAEFVKFAARSPEAFEVHDLDPDDRIPFGRRGDFFRYLVDHDALLPPGAVVVIHGPKADGLAHYHSFLIDAVDPISGLPYRLAGNAGRPRLQSWEGVMRSAPLRSIKHIVVPRLEWLESTLKPAQQRPSEP